MANQYTTGISPGYGENTFSTRKNQLSRQQMLANALLKQSQEPLQSSPTPHGGLAVPISPWQGAAKLAQALGASYLQERADKKSSDMEKERLQKMTQAIGEFDKMRTGTPAQQIDIFGSDPDNPTRKMTQEIAPDPRGASLSLINSGLPELQQFGMKSLLEQKGPENLFDKLNPKDYTSESLARFGQTQNYSDLIPSRKMDFVNGQAVDAYNIQPGTKIAPQSNPASDLMIPGKDGSYVPNQQLIGIRENLSRSGAPKMNISNEFKAAEGIAAQVGPIMRESISKAESGIKLENAADQILNGLDVNSGAFTGPGANIKLKLSQITNMLGISGKSIDENIKNTRMVIQGLAKLTLEARKEMAKQGAITEKESLLAQRAMSGDIDFTATELRTLANVAKRAAKFRYSEHQRKLEIMKNDPNLSGIAPFYEVSGMKQDSKIPAQETLKLSLPPGFEIIGVD